MNLAIAGHVIEIPMTHFTLTVMLALLVSIITAALGKRTLRERRHHAAYLFVSCLFAVVAGSWAMALIHG